MKDLIGRKVRGFKFEDKKYNGLNYCPAMNRFIGEVGIITEVGKANNNYVVKFNNISFIYPAELIEQHLVEDPINRDVLRQELEKFAEYYENHGSYFISTQTKNCIDEYFEYLDKEENPTKELTLQEIADKFNVPVDKIRIKE